MTESQLRDRIVTDPRIFGGKPIIRGRRLAVERHGDVLMVGGIVTVEPGRLQIRPAGES